MEPDGRLTTLFKLPTPGHFMVHDMFLSKEHLLLAIPPSKSTSPPSSPAAPPSPTPALLRVRTRPPHRHAPRRLGPARHRRTAPQHGLPQRQRLRAATATSSSIPCSTPTTPSWTPSTTGRPITSRRRPARTHPPRHRSRPRAEVSRAPPRGDCEFPRFDIRRTGADARYLYTVQASEAESPGVAPWGSHVVRHDLHTGAVDRIAAGPGRALGEAVFVPRPASDGAAPADPRRRKRRLAPLPGLRRRPRRKLPRNPRRRLPRIRGPRLDRHPLPPRLPRQLHDGALHRLIPFSHGGTTKRPEAFSPEPSGLAFFAAPSPGWGPATTCPPPRPATRYSIRVP
jgi:hypothetical protein